MVSSSYNIDGIARHVHQLKNSELPKNEKMSFLLQFSTKFRSRNTIKF